MAVRDGDGRLSPVSKLRRQPCTHERANLSCSYALVEAVELTHHDQVVPWPRGHATSLV